MGNMIPAPMPNIDPGCWTQYDTDSGYGVGQLHRFEAFAPLYHNGWVDCDCHVTGTCLNGEPPLPPLNEFMSDPNLNKALKEGIGITIDNGPFANAPVSPADNGRVPALLADDSRIANPNSPKFIYKAKHKRSYGDMELPTQEKPPPKLVKPELAKWLSQEDPGDVEEMFKYYKVEDESPDAEGPSEIDAILHRAAEKTKEEALKASGKGRRRNGNRKKQGKSQSAEMLDQSREDEESGEYDNSEDVPATKTTSIGDEEKVTMPPAIPDEESGEGLDRLEENREGEFDDYEDAPATNTTSIEDEEDLTKPSAVPNDDSEWLPEQTEEDERLAEEQAAEESKEFQQHERTKKTKEEKAAEKAKKAEDIAEARAAVAVRDKEIYDEYMAMNTDDSWHPTPNDKVMVAPYPFPFTVVRGFMSLPKERKENILRRWPFFELVLTSITKDYSAKIPDLDPKVLMAIEMGNPGGVAGDIVRSGTKRYANTLLQCFRLSANTFFPAIEEEAKRVHKARKAEIKAIKKANKLAGRPDDPIPEAPEDQIMPIFNVLWNYWYFWRGTVPDGLYSKGTDHDHFYYSKDPEKPYRRVFRLGRVMCGAFLENTLNEMKAGNHTFVASIPEILEGIKSTILIYPDNKMFRFLQLVPNMTANAFGTNLTLIPELFKETEPQIRIGMSLWAASLWTGAGTYSKDYWGVGLGD